MPRDPMREATGTVACGCSNPDRCDCYRGRIGREISISNRWGGSDDVPTMLDEEDRAAVDRYLDARRVTVGCPVCHVAQVTCWLGEDGDIEWIEAECGCEDTCSMGPDKYVGALHAIASVTVTL